MSPQKLASYAAAAMIVVGAIYLIRTTPEASATRKAKDVTAETKSGATGSLTTTPIKLSAVTLVQEPLSRLLAAGRNIAAALLPSTVEQHKGQNALQPQGSAASQRAAYAAPLRPEYRVTALAGGPRNVIHLPGLFTPKTNV